jgi:hypothetical protein
MSSCHFSIPTPCLIDSRRSLGRVTANLIMAAVWERMLASLESPKGKFYLVRAELELVLLIWNQSTDFHGERAIALSQNQRKIPMLKVHVVGALKVVKDCNLLLRAGLAVAQFEPIVLGVDTLVGILRVFFKDEFLDRVYLVICMSKVSQCHKP